MTAQKGHFDDMADSDLDAVAIKDPTEAIRRRALIDASHLRVGFENLIKEIGEQLKRYTPEQIAKSKLLTKRQKRLAFYELCLKDFDYRSTNNIRKAKRKTYLLGYGCPVCGCTVRVTQKWLDLGTPPCFNEECDRKGKPMEPSEKVDAPIFSPEETKKMLEEMQRDHEEGLNY